MKNKESLFSRFSCFCRRFKAKFRKSYITRKEGLIMAKKYDLQDEYLYALHYGMTPDEALEEWDLLPLIENNKVDEGER